MHVGTLFLGGISPRADSEFLYSGKFEGEAGRLLSVVGIAPANKSAEAVLAEFQRGGFFLAHVLECPLEEKQEESSSIDGLLARQVSFVVARIRRSLKPKRIVFISESLTFLLDRLAGADLGCPLVLDAGRPFALDSAVSEQAAGRLREALAALTTAAR